MTARPVRPLMLGAGWFPESLGGLERYYRDLLEHLPEASGVVIAERDPSLDRVTSAASPQRALLDRLRSYRRAAVDQHGDADVLDVHFALYALPALYVGRARSLPVLLHFHGPWADENVAAGDGSELRRVVRRRIERAVYRRAEHAVVLTSAFRRLLVERYGVSPWRVSVEPPGVDLGHFSPGSAMESRRRLNLEPGAFVAAAVRRLVPRMGLDVLVDAWAASVDALPPGSMLLVAGEGPLRSALEDRIVELGLTRSVRLLGRVEDDELVDVYRAADVAVVPSVAHEGFGLVVIEAAACGTPTIVTAVGGLPEAVAGLDRTLIVPPADAPALATRLGEAAWDRPTRRATRAYAERFDWSAVAERHRGVLRRVAARAGRDDRLRVVYLDHVAQLSGGEIALLRLLPHLDRVQPHVLLAEDGPLVAELHLAGISTEVLAMAPKARELRKDEVADPRSSASVAAATAAYVLRLARRLRQLQPDVVHANSLKAGVYGSLACRLARVPLVWHVRDRVAEDYLPPRAIGLVRGLVQHVPAAVIANSQATMDTIVTRAPAPGTWKVIPDPVGSATVPSRATGDPTTYGMLGRLAPWKGQDLFLRAFAHAFPQGTERAVVVGGALFGEDRYAGSLTSLSRRLGIADRVEFRGFRADVWDELARLDVLVHASTTPEPFGQVITEGMAAGVPVVASGAGGPLEIIDHERTGLLFPPNDERGLAGAMRRMLDPALRERLRSAGRDEVRRYEPAAVATTVQDVYETVATRRRPS